MRIESNIPSAMQNKLQPTDGVPRLRGGVSLVGIPTTIKYAQDKSTSSPLTSVGSGNESPMRRSTKPAHRFYTLVYRFPIYPSCATQLLKRTRCAEETRKNTAVGRERHAGVEGELNPRGETQQDRPAFKATPRQREGKTIDKEFALVPVKICLCAEYEEKMSSIVNVSAAFQSIPSILFSIENKELQ